MKLTICPKCESTAIVTEPDDGMKWCAQCGEIVEQGKGEKTKE